MTVKEFVTHKIEKWPWDVPPRRESIECVLNFCDLFPNDYPEPSRIYVDSDGIIGIVWDDRIELIPYGGEGIAHFHYGEHIWLRRFELDRIPDFMKQYFDGILKPNILYWSKGHL